MPKNSENYSNTTIYKITCKDNTVKDCYVGHTSNFKNRIYTHKSNCINKNKTYVYQFINNNGGWNNWEMTSIETHCCQDNIEARTLEQVWCKKLKATLNSIDSIFNPFDNEQFITASKDNTIINRERTHFKRRKEREELLYLREENKRLKKLLLDNVFKYNPIKETVV